ncbi:tetratricopeptide repeat protein [Streptomyces sp. bgisy153]|uniref:tetratricopeptide repeat protein n=1 Tax=Streptomyces sp. bgisy153 TaxID=3413793 RepID=UPI003D752906
MSRLSREKQRETAVVVPLEVRVPGTGAAGATIGGVPVGATGDEEIHHAVLRHLHRVALATGHPVLATVHDSRIGYVVPLRVDPDGSSHFTAEPVRTGALQEAARSAADSPPTFRLRAVPSGPTPPEAGAEVEAEAGSDSSPSPSDSASASASGAIPAPGTATAPTGVFGPPPSMPLAAEPTDAEAPAAVRTSFEPVPITPPAPLPVAPAARVAPVAPVAPVPEDALVAELAMEDARPTPARGFDAVAEAVLAEEEPGAGPGGDAALLAEPMRRVNAAVRAGRTEEAGQIADHTVAEASQALGPHHPEVLRLRELTAYIAYLADDPLRAFHLSLDLTRIHRRLGDAEAAYGNVQSAAAAWRAVRDPLQGLDLGQELLTLWTELTTEDGPAADEAEALDSARARMHRLTDRARKAGREPGR